MTAGNAAIDPTIAWDESSSCFDEDLVQEGMNTSTTKRKVTFDPQALCYSSPWVIIRGAESNRENEPPQQDDPANEKIAVFQRNAWYTRTEVNKFKHDAQVYANQVQTREREKSISAQRPWSQTIHRVYRAFVEHEGSKLVTRILDCAPSADPMNLGLDKFFPDVGTTRSRQRRILYATVRRAQECSVPVSEREFCHMCQEHSRPSRLFALYLARTVAPAASETEL